MSQDSFFSFDENCCFCTLSDRYVQGASMSLESKKVIRKRELLCYVMYREAPCKDMAGGQFFKGKEAIG